MCPVPYLKSGLSRVGVLIMTAPTRLWVASYMPNAVGGTNVAPREQSCAMPGLSRALRTRSLRRQEEKKVSPPPPTIIYMYPTDRQRRSVVHHAGMRMSTPSISCPQGTTHKVLKVLNLPYKMLRMFSSQESYFCSRVSQATSRERPIRPSTAAVQLDGRHMQDTALE